MKRDKIMESFKMLAKSQGFYGRIVQTIEVMNEERQKSLFDELEAQNFNDVVDLIMYIED